MKSIADSTEKVSKAQSVMEEQKLVMEDQKLANDYAMKLLQEQMEESFDDDKEQEPRQLFDDAPLKEEAVLDPKIVQDSPEAEELNQEVIDDEVMAEDQYGRLYGSDEGVHQEEDSFVSADRQSFNIPGQKTARKLSNRDAESTRKSFSQDARGRSLIGQLSRAKCKMLIYKFKNH